MGVCGVCDTSPKFEKTEHLGQNSWNITKSGKIWFGRAGQHTWSLFYILIMY